MRASYVAGAGMVRFGKYKDLLLEDLAEDAARRALADSGVRPDQIEAVYFGHVFGGPVAGQRVAVRLGVGGIPVSNHENYCASGATALREAWTAIGAGMFEIALVVGMEKMSDRVKGGLTPDPNDLDAAVGYVMTAGHAMSARRYILDHDATREQIAMVSVKNHRHAKYNPYAQYQEPVSLEQVLGARPICEPLGLLDCSPIGDGAAAVVVASRSGLRKLGIMGRRPRVSGCALVSGRLRVGAGDINAEDISRRAGEQAYGMAAIDPSDVDVVEMHDCFTIAEIVRLEGLGLIPAGQGGRWVEEGRTWIGGELPVNPSGGLLSRGHPVGATGVAQVCELTWQLTSQAGQRQVDGAQVGLAYCKGGTVPGTDGASVSVVVMKN
ncbi:MAG: thiolase family protein [Candidatus Dormibacteraeota bacterium]|uniref:propanoyl-CoA C-acyltransferase n=2 Tax=Candidatus Dormibacteria TaxID=3126996 RepID=A0A934JZ94_9BACT|nr:thiolase family protein [Candidatus Dormibacteraeota bacterium]MBJ7603962.1 thiolase family protein [Candidatus Dormibacteraeota bacterium]MBJ7607159.1 thiolase family protein [Candidatus Dormibacteraeota bacterium]